MTKMEEKQKKLETELQLLALTRSKTAAIVDKGNLDKILRHKEALKKIVNAIEDLKVDIEKAKLEAGEIIENVEKWGATIEQCINEADLEISDLGPVHTNAFSFENAYFFIRFRLPSTLIRSKTEVYVCENGGFRKRSLEWRFLKMEVQRLCVDGGKRRFSVFVWTGENGDFRKRLRHWHWHVPVKKAKRMFSYPFSVVQCGRSKTLQKR